LDPPDKSFEKIGLHYKNEANSVHGFTIMKSQISEQSWHYSRKRGLFVFKNKFIYLFKYWRVCRNANATGKSSTA